MYRLQCKNFDNVKFLQNNHYVKQNANPSLIANLIFVQFRRLKILIYLNIFCVEILQRDPKSVSLGAQPEIANVNISQ